MKSFKQAENLIHNCEVRKAEYFLREYARECLEAGHRQEYLSSQLLLVRALAELERAHEIPSLISETQSVLSEDDASMTAKCYYTKAVCESYSGRNEKAFLYCEKALQIATDNQDYKNLLYAMSGLVICNMALQKYEEALVLLEKMNLIFKTTPVLEIKVTAAINKVKILSHLHKFAEAQAALLEAIELVRNQKSLLNHILLTTAQGELLAERGDYDLAKQHFTMASRLCDPQELPYRSKLIKNEIQKLPSTTADVDLKINLQSHSVFERSRGEISFKNQFILFDLLKALNEKRGACLNKEDIVQKIWNESYDPRTHDNKIYVTIKRLRHLIEPSPDKPKYVFRSKDGYYLTNNNYKDTEMDVL